MAFKIHFAQIPYCFIKIKSPQFDQFDHLMRKYPMRRTQHYNAMVDYAKT